MTQSSFSLLFDDDDDNNSSNGSDNGFWGVQLQVNGRLNVIHILLIRCNGIDVKDAVPFFYRKIFISVIKSDCFICISSFFVFSQFASRNFTCDVS